MSICQLPYSLVRSIFVICCFALIPSQFLAADARRPTVGLMAELSGPFSSIGDECRRGWEVAEAEMIPRLTKPPEIVVGDHQRDPKTALSEFRKFTDQRKIIGLVFNASPIGLTLNPVSAKSEIPILGSVSHPKFTEGNPFAWRFWTSATTEGKQLAEYVRAAGFQRISVLTLEDDYTVAVSESFISALKELGLTVVSNERILKSETEFATVISRIQRGGSDAIFVNVVGDALATILRRIKEQRLPQKVYTSFSLGKPEIRAAAGLEAIENASFIEIDGEKRWFAAQMRTRYSADNVTSLNYGCFLALWGMLTAFERNPSITTSHGLQSELSKIDTLTTPDGTVKIVNREAQVGMLLRTVKGGKLETSR